MINRTRRPSGFAIVTAARQENTYIEIQSESNNIKGKLYFNLYYEKEPAICDFFKNLLISTCMMKGKTENKFKSKVSGNYILPNFEGCYCQFGAVKDISEVERKQLLMELGNVSEGVPDDYREGQLFYLKDSLEFVIAYCTHMMENTVLIGEVDEGSMWLFNQIKNTGSIDGKGLQFIQIIDSDVESEL